MIRVQHRYIKSTTLRKQDWIIHLAPPQSQKEIKEKIRATGIRPCNDNDDDDDDANSNPTICPIPGYAKNAIPRREKNNSNRPLFDLFHVDN
jgi:hypothetical protein